MNPMCGDIFCRACLEYPLIISSTGNIVLTVLMFLTEAPTWFLMARWVSLSSSAL